MKIGMELILRWGSVQGVQSSVNELYYHFNEKDRSQVPRWSQRVNVVFQDIKRQELMFSIYYPDARAYREILSPRF